ncbi:MAG TPA: hypothetical protein VGG91_01705 [Myxococcaceae bacterium]|jgi:hypothetical protein
MTGDLGRAGRIGAWVALALVALTACNAAPAATAGGGTTGAQATPMSAAVRAATDRSGVQQDKLTLQGGEQVRRLSLGTGFNHVAVSRVGPDGKPVVGCVDSPAEAEAFLSAGRQGAGQ